MRLTVNGETTTVENAETLSEVLDKLGYEGESFAVAVNGNFVPRAQYRDHRLADGDHLEVLFPMRGG